MYWENIVIDARDPRTLGRFWEEALGTKQLTDEPGIYETRLHLDLRGGTEQQPTVDRLVGLGARHLDIGQRDVPWVVLGDPEGNPFCVMEERDVYVDTGPIAALPLDSGDPGRDVGLWAWLTGWGPVPGVATPSLRHPSGREYHPDWGDLPWRFFADGSGNEFCLLPARG